MNDPRFALIDMLERIERVLAYTAAGREEFLSSPMQQDAVIRNLEVIGEAAKRVTPDVRGDMPEVQWQEIAGMRDVLIHRYDSVDLHIVWQVVERNLHPLRDQIRGYLQGQDDIERR